MITSKAGTESGNDSLRQASAPGRSPIALIVGFCLFAVLASSQPLFAALGENVDSVARDRRAMSAARGATTVRAGYTVQEIVSDSVTVREYISPAGIVFGVAWNGYTQPDLTQLLGAYAREYDDALRKTKRKPGRRHAQIKTGRIIVEKWGHMRNLQGRAYVEALIPQGVSIDEIK